MGRRAPLLLLLLLRALLAAAALLSVAVAVCATSVRSVEPREGPFDGGNVVTIVANRVVARYSFNSAAAPLADVSGNGFDALAVGNATLTEGREMQLGGFADPAYLQLPGALTAQFNSTEISLALWLRLRDSFPLEENTGFARMDTCCTDTINENSFFPYWVGDDRAYFSMFRANARVALPLPSSLPRDRWHHLAFSSSPRFGWNFWMNEHLLAQATQGVFSVGSWLVGKSKEDRYIDGWLDEVRLYGFPLSDLETEQLSRRASLLLYLPFESPSAPFDVADVTSTSAYTELREGANVTSSDAAVGKGCLQLSGRAHVLLAEYITPFLSNYSSFSAWVRLAAAQPNASQNALAQLRSPAGNSTEYPLPAGSGGEAGLAAFGLLRSAAVNVTLASDVDRTQWHLVTVVRHPLRGYQVYQNARLLYTAAASSLESFLPAPPYYVGREGERFLQGRLDDVRFYNSSLTHKEVAGLFFNGAMLCRFAFDNASAPLVDETYRSLAGTLLGTAAVTRAVAFEGAGSVRVSQSGDGFAVPTLSTLVGAGAQSVALAFWVRVDTGAGAGRGGNVNALGLLGGAGACSRVLVDGNTTTLSLAVLRQSAVNVTLPSWVNVSLWTHVAVNADAQSGQWAVFVNGALLANSSLDALSVPATAYFGYCSAAESLPAWFDEIRVYPRLLTALELSAATVMFDFALGTGTDITRVELAGTQAVILAQTPYSVVVRANQTAVAGNGTVRIVSETFGETTLPSGYTYTPKGVVTEVRPTEGPFVGGNTVTLIGTNLGSNGDVSEVTLSTVPAVILSQTSTVIVVQPRSADAVGPGIGGVRIVSAAQGLTTLADGYRYNVKGIVDAVSPGLGPFVGGNLVNVSGAFLGNGADVFRVLLKNVSATIQQQAQHWVLVRPASLVGTNLSSGIGDAEVFSTAYGYSNLTDAYTYNPLGGITSVEPSTGPLYGGNLITILGFQMSNGFDVVSVTIKNVPALFVNVTSSSRLLVVAGNATSSGAGIGDVVVLSTSFGTSRGVNRYRYNLRGLISSLAPSNGPFAGHNYVTVSGSSLGNGSDVFVVRIYGMNQTIVAQTATSVTLRMIDAGLFGLPAGTGDLFMESVSFGTTAKGQVYTYNPKGVFSFVVPTSGPYVGGNALTIWGSNFGVGDIVSVQVLGLLATIVQQQSHVVTVLAANADRANVAPGLGDIQIISASYGNTSASQAYLYEPPGVIYSVVPCSGPLAGFNLITIIGDNLNNGWDTTQVSVAGVACDLSPVQNRTHIVARVFPRSAFVDGPVVVSSISLGVTTGPGWYTYQTSGSVAGVVPSEGPQAGNVSVTISGTSLANALAGDVDSVTFAGIRAQVVSQSLQFARSTVASRAFALITSQVQRTASAALSSFMFVTVFAAAVDPAKYPLSFGVDVYAYRMLSTGVLASVDPALLNQNQAGDQFDPCVVALPDQGYLAVWTSNSGDDGSGLSVMMRRFDVNDVPQTNDLVVSQTTAGHQQHPAATFTADNRVVIVWTSADGSDNGVYARYFSVASSGVTADSSEFRVNTYTTANQTRPSVAFSFDRLLVVWQSLEQDGSGYGVYGQLYDTYRDALGGEFALHSDTLGDQARPHAATMTKRGTFVVAYESRNTSLYAVVDYLGVRGASDVSVYAGSFGGGNVSEPFVAALGRGAWAIGFTLALDAGGSVALVRIFDPEGDVVPAWAPNPLGAAQGLTSLVCETSTAAFRLIVAHKDGLDVRMNQYVLTGTSTLIVRPAASAVPQSGAVVVTSRTRGISTSAFQFRYNPAAVVRNIFPSAAPRLGNSPLTVVGQFLGSGSDVTSVVFNETSLVIQSQTSTRVIVLSPPVAAAKSENLAVVMASFAFGFGVFAPFNFTWNPDGLLLEIRHWIGPQRGNSIVTVIGRNICNGSDAVAVHVASVPARILWQVADMVVVSTSAANSARNGSVFVSSTTYGNTTGLLYRYNPEGFITRVVPTSGAYHGGYTVTVFGTNLSNGTDAVAVWLGDTKCPRVQQQNATMVVFVAERAVATTLVTAMVEAVEFGNSTLANSFRYNLPGLITSVVPSSASFGGGSHITINGQNLGTGLDVVRVTLAGVPAAQILLQTPTRVVVRTRNVTLEGTRNGSVLVESTSFGSTNSSASSPPLFFSYNPPGNITRIFPEAGPRAEWKTVTVYGSLLGYGDVVRCFLSGAVGEVLDGSQSSVAVVRLPPVPASAVGNASVGLESTLAGNTTANATLFVNNPSGAISSIVPDKSAQRGGLPITVTGTFLGSGSDVTAVEWNGARVQILSQTTSSVVVSGPASPTSNDITLVIDVLSVRFGRTTSPGTAFSYNPPGVMSSFQPTSGPLAGGAVVTISGVNLGAGTDISRVTLAGVEAIIVSQAHTATTSTVVVQCAPAPAAQSGSVVTESRTFGVASTQNMSATSGNFTTNRFTYNPAGVISWIYPPSGPLHGGQLLTIYGSNLGSGSDVTRVLVGSATCDVVEQSESSVVCSTPATGAVGTQAVTTLSRAFGSSFFFNYAYNPLGSVLDFFPSEGPYHGGNAVTVLGAGFSNGSDVTNVTFAAGSGYCVVTFQNASVVVCVAQPGSAGSALLRVESLRFGRTASTVPYTYHPPGVIGSVYPSVGPLRGGALVTIAGSGLGSGSDVFNVTLAGVPAAAIVAQSTSQVVVLSSGRWASGEGSVVVTSRTRGVTQRPASFFYNAEFPIQSVVPSTGPLVGGNVVTVLSAGRVGNGTDVTSVLFGSLESTLLAQAASWVVVRAPSAASIGNQSVNVSTLSSSFGRFVAVRAYYFNPAGSIARLAPSSSPLYGGLLLTIDGDNLGNGSDVYGVVFNGLFSSDVVAQSRVRVLVRAAAAASEGTGDVVVRSVSFGDTLLANGHTYNPRGSITAVTPAAGGMLGCGQRVTVLGVNLGSGTDITAVMVGDSISTFVLAQSASWVIFVRSNASLSGLAEVRVLSTTFGFTSTNTTIGDAFDLLRARIDTVWPAVGPRHGGFNVSLSGADLSNGTDETSVTFGSSARVGRVFFAKTVAQVVVQTPESALNDSTVQLTYYSSCYGSATPAQTYSFSVDASISEVVPSAGPVDGGLWSVTVRGSNLCDGSDVQRVEFAGFYDWGVLSQTPSEIVAVLPAPGVVATGPLVTVSLAFGRASAPGGFRFTERPVITPLFNITDPALLTLGIGQYFELRFRCDDDDLLPMTAEVNAASDQDGGSGEPAPAWMRVTVEVPSGLLGFPEDFVIVSVLGTVGAGFSGPLPIDLIVRDQYDVPRTQLLPFVVPPEVPRVLATLGTRFVFAIPPGYFAPGVYQNVSAALLDGGPLPAWLVFEEATRSFVLSTPAALFSTLAVSVTARYSANTSVVVQQTFVVRANRAPVARADVGPLYLAYGSSFRFDFPANLMSDADNDTLTWSIERVGGSDAQMPVWTAFDAVRRRLTGVAPDPGVELNVEFALVASDGFASARSRGSLRVLNVVSVLGIVGIVCGSVAAAVAIVLVVVCLVRRYRRTKLLYATEITERDVASWVGPAGVLVPNDPAAAVVKRHDDDLYQSPSAEATRTAAAATKGRRTGAAAAAAAAAAKMSDSPLLRKVLGSERPGSKTDVLLFVDSPASSPSRSARPSQRGTAHTKRRIMPKSFAAASPSADDVDAGSEAGAGRV